MTHAQCSLPVYYSQVYVMGCVFMCSRISYLIWQRSTDLNLNLCSISGRDGCINRQKNRELFGGKLLLSFLSTFSFSHTYMNETVWYSMGTNEMIHDC